MLVMLTTDRMKLYQSPQLTGHFGKYVTAAAVLTFKCTLTLKEHKILLQKDRTRL